MTFQKTLFLWIILHPHAQRCGGTYSVGSNRKIYAYSKSLHEQCQKTTLYMHWGSGLLRGDNKETLTNNCGHIHKYWKPRKKKESKIKTSNPIKNPTHIHWCGWVVTLHSHGYMRTEAARSAHTVLHSSHTHHIVSHPRPMSSQLLLWVQETSINILHAIKWVHFALSLDH
jgi:hypothetical protein